MPLELIKSQEIYPHRNAYHTNFVWEWGVELMSMSDELKWLREGGETNQCWRLLMKNDVITGYVCWDCNQVWSWMINVDLKVDADEHVIICILSSSGALHRRQFDDTLCFLWIITLPEAMAALIHFVINIDSPNLECDLLYLFQSQLTRDPKSKRLSSNIFET